MLNNRMRRYISILCFLAGCFASIGQTTDGMVVYYDFNDVTTTTLQDKAGGGSDGALAGAPLLVCGVEGDALRFDGLNDHALFLGSISNFFDNDDFFKF